MKILVLSFYYAPDLSAGSFRTTALVEALVEQGADSVDVITTMPNRYHGFDAKALASEQQGNVSIQRVELPGHKNGLVDQIRCFKTFAHRAMKMAKGQQYDLVYATSSRLMTAWLGARIANRLKAPLYLDIRDIFADTVKDVFTGWKGKVLFPVLSAVERWTMKQAKAINIVSEGFKPYFEERYGQLPLRVFTNGIDDEFLALGFEPKAVNAEPIDVLYAGNIGEGQGLHHIVGPLAQALGDKVCFKIVGSGGRLQQLQESVAGLENVELLAPVKRAELIAMYEAADVLFLHLNDYDAFLKVLPSKLFEYGATGKPILAGVAGYAATFASTELDNCAVFSPCDAKAGVAALNSLAIEQRERTSFKEKFARKHIMQRMAQDILQQG